MKIDEKIRKKLIGNLKECKKETKDCYDYYIRKIQNCESVEKLMMYKKRLMTVLLDDFFLIQWMNVISVFYILKKKEILIVRIASMEKYMGYAMKTAVITMNTRYLEAFFVII